MVNVQLDARRSKPVPNLQFEVDSNLTPCVIGIFIFDFTSCADQLEPRCITDLFHCIFTPVLWCGLRGIVAIKRGNRFFCKVEVAELAC